jgi:hypothetical protein
MEPVGYYVYYDICNSTHTRKPSCGEILEMDAQDELSEKHRISADPDLPDRKTGSGKCLADLPGAQESGGIFAGDFKPPHRTIPIPDAIPVDLYFGHTTLEIMLRG